MHHKFRISRDIFQAKLDGIKPWENRRTYANPFTVGDTVSFLELDPNDPKATCRGCGPYDITYVQCSGTDWAIFTHSTGRKICETCSHRNDHGVCMNINKLNEAGEFGSNELKDMLVYSSQEGGAFEVGPLFGCVHHRERASLPSQV